MKYLLKRSLQTEGLKPTANDASSDNDSVERYSETPCKRVRTVKHSARRADKMMHNPYLYNAFESHADRIARERAKELINRKYEQSRLEAERKEEGSV